MTASSGLPHEMILKLMVDSHGARFDGLIWDAFDQLVVPTLPQKPRIADLGCGPGLFAFDVFQKLPDSELWGYDTSAVMLDFAANLAWGQAQPRFIKCDASCGFPGCPQGFNLIAMNFFLNQFDYPLSILFECKRQLNEGGLIWLYDWARCPIEQYLEFWHSEPGLSEAYQDESAPWRLFPNHNRFTEGDWLFIFEKAGLTLIDSAKRQGGQHMLFILACQTKA